jgi:hypothetical protein
MTTPTLRDPAKPLVPSVGSTSDENARPNTQVFYQLALQSSMFNPDSRSPIRALAAGRAVAPLSHASAPASAALKSP